MSPAGIQPFGIQPFTLLATKHAEALSLADGHRATTTSAPRLPAFVGDVVSTQVQRVSATGQATGRNPEGQRVLLWLGDGHTVTGSFNGNQTVAKALEVQQSGHWTLSVYRAECQCPEKWKFHSWILLLNRVVSGGKEGRWIRATRATSCFPLLVTPAATQLYLNAAASKCSAGRIAARVWLLMWSHLIHQESTSKNKNEKGLLLPLI